MGRQNPWEKLLVRRLNIENNEKSGGKIENQSPTALQLNTI